MHEVGREERGALARPAPTRATIPWPPGRRGPGRSRRAARRRRRGPRLGEQSADHEGEPAGGAAGARLVVAFGIGTGESAAARPPRCRGSRRRPRRRRRAVSTCRSSDDDRRAERLEERRGHERADGDQGREPEEPAPGAGRQAHLRRATTRTAVPVTVSRISAIPTIAGTSRARLTTKTSRSGHGPYSTNSPPTSGPMREPGHGGRRARGSPRGACRRAARGRRASRSPRP